MLKQVIKLLKVLNSDTDPGQVAAGIAFAMLLGFTPVLSLHNLLVLLLVCVLRVNISALLLAWAALTPIAYLLDPLFISVGEHLLLDEGLKPFWTGLYQQDIWRLAHFNNTLTLGSLVVSLCAFLPVFFVSRLLIVKYRQRILAWVRKTRLIQTLKASKIVQAVMRVSDMAEEA